MIVLKGFNILGHVREQILAQIKILLRVFGNIMAQEEIQVTDASDAVHDVDEERLFPFISISISISISIWPQLAFECDFGGIVTKDAASEVRSLQAQLERSETELDHVLEVGPCIDRVAADALDGDGNDAASDELLGPGVALCSRGGGLVEEVRNLIVHGVFLSR
jgi:hypothetical protein